MKKIGTLLLASACLVSVNAFAVESTVTIDTAKSTLKWTGEKVTGSHNGVVAIKSGTAKLDGSNLVGGEFEMGMKSIAVKDLEDPSYNKKLTDHLNSDDFFSTDKFPESKFVITNTEKIEAATDADSNYKITGDLTIKGVTFPLTFPARVDVKDGVATATAHAAVDRTKYNIRYGSGKFFEGLGDKLIYDEFKIDLELTGAVK